MNCDACQDLVLNAVDEPLSPQEAGWVAAHFASCPACRAFQEAQQQLDRAITGRLGGVQLSAGFSGRVRAAIQAAPAPLDDAVRQRRRAEIEAEWQQFAQFHRSWWRSWLPRGLDLGALAAVLGVGVTLVMRFGPTLMARLPGAGGYIDAHLLQAQGLLLIALSAAAGLWLAWNRSWISALSDSGGG